MFARCGRESRLIMKLSGYTVLIGQNGMKYVDPSTVPGNEIHMPCGSNSKVGDALTFSLPIELTCSHAFECYKNRDCYGCHGCYHYASNQALYADNLAFFFSHTSREFVDAINAKIRENGVDASRWFGVGDIVNRRFLDCMIDAARENPDVEFWGYTKKYAIVNRWCDENGVENWPENLSLLFSHWRNRDGSFAPMDNRYNFPTSEFIPVGHEHEIDENTFVCPCSDPDFVGTCMTCEKPCRRMKRGQHVALLEHSTARTKERDAAIRAARKLLNV